jgi:FAD:protein FMN transferase
MFNEDGVGVLRHEAMAAAFALRIAGVEEQYARQAAQAAWDELDRIEGRLSRFAEGSDVFRINRLAAGQDTVVHVDTFECLRMAWEVQQDTDGAFDVAYASTAPADRPRFQLDESHHAVRVLADGVRLDLGGIGKGFALDRMATLLREWDVESALLCASTSTVLALGPPPGQTGWPVSIGPDHDLRRRRLSHGALSGSGRAVHGDHIIDPRTRRPAQDRAAAWSVAPTAALADALSTAFMIMPDDQIRGYCRRHPGVAAYLLASASSALATM